VICLGWWIGFGLFLSLYSVVLCLTASSLIYVFYVQHIFENSYANPSQGWSPMRGALEGSSLLVLPPLLQWFTPTLVSTTFITSVNGFLITTWKLAISRINTFFKMCRR
jgi:hypothetical protein